MSWYTAMYLRLSAAGTLLGRKITGGDFSADDGIACRMSAENSRCDCRRDEGGRLSFRSSLPSRLVPDTPEVRREKATTFKK